MLALFPPRHNIISAVIEGRDVRSAMGVKKTLFAAGAGALLLVLGACTGQSDAARIVEGDNVSLRATISFYQNIDPTLTAQAGVYINQIGTLQADLSAAQAQLRNLTVQVNTGTAAPGVQPVVPVIQPTPDPSSFSSVPTLAVPGGGDPTSVAGSVPVSTPAPAVPAGPVRSASGLIIEQVVTAKGKDANDCAVNTTSSFSTTDAQIMAIAVVKNFQRGTKFSTKWSGAALNQQYDWTIERRGTQICVFFYIEPASLGLAPGAYSVVFMATEPDGSSIESAPVGFTLQ
jgi:hypothetical protein